jgi:protein-L-isoaspartate(D-aspartate) O-methyltransferase
MENTLDLGVARTNMLTNQIRAWSVLDERVLEVCATVARELFVPAAYRNLAYADMMVPLAHHQCMWPPKLEARMLQALAVRPTDAVLEIGTGSGYVTALLARLGAYVTSVDLYPEFCEAAGRLLADHGIRNVRLEVGNAAAGWPAHAPYDVILVTGSVPEVPPGLLASLRPGGRMGVIVGQSTPMHAALIVCEAPDEFRTVRLLETSVPPLEHVRTKPRFEF